MPRPGLSAADETLPGVELVDIWRDTVGAGLRYWGRLGRLALEGAVALFPLVTQVRPGVDKPAVGPPPEAGEDRTILVEAEAGEAAYGVFLVENTTAEELSTLVTVSSFVGDDGREVHPAVTFRPDVIALGPGEQLIVQMAAAVDETLEPGVRYRAEIGVPELSEQRIPVVVRRRRSAKPRAAAPRNRRAAGRPKGQRKATTPGS